MQYLGDIKAGRTLDFAFDTQADGLPSSLSAATVKVYKGSSTTTEVTTGVTHTEDFDALTGLNHVTIDTSADGAFYAAGNDFAVVLTAGTLNGQSIRRVLAHFSIENRMPDAASIRSAVGLASANLDTQLSTIDDYIDTEITTIINDLTALQGDVTSILDDTGTSGVAVADKTGYRLSATGVDDIFDEAMAGHTTAGTFGDKLRANLGGVLKAVIGAGSTTTAIKLSTVEGAAPSATDDFYAGAVIVFLTGTLAGQRTDITAYAGATTTATVTATTSAPANTDTAVIV